MGVDDSTTCKSKEKKYIVITSKWSHNFTLEYKEHDLKLKLTNDIEGKREGWH